jgi:hypothetical protein
LDAIGDEEKVGRLGTGLEAPREIRGPLEQAGRTRRRNESVDTCLAERALLEVWQEPAGVDRHLGTVDDQPAIVDHKIGSGRAERSDRRQRLTDPRRQGETGGRASG